MLACVDGARSRIPLPVNVLQTRDTSRVHWPQPRSRDRALTAWPDGWAGRLASHEVTELDPSGLGFAKVSHPVAEDDSTSHSAAETRIAAP